MLKHLMLAGSMTIALPAMAQQAPAPAGTNAPAAQGQTTPEPATPPADTAAQPAPATPAPAQPAPDGTAATAAPADGQPATNGSQVAAVVDREFPTYDRDGNGSLNQAEFGSWLVALRRASEPGFNGTDTAGQTWVRQAFAQADADRSRSITKAELVTFLTPRGAS